MPDIFDLLLFVDGFKMYHKHRSSAKSGGCIIYVRSDILSTLIFLEGYELLDDAIFITIDNCAQKHFIKVCIYRPTNAARAVDAYLNEVLTYLFSLPVAKIISYELNMPSVSWNSLRGHSHIEKFIKVVEANS